jgi:acetyl esterase
VNTPRLHPKIAAALESRKGAAAPSTLPLEVVRANDIMLFSGNIPDIEVSIIRDISVAGDSGQIPVRIYQPDGSDTAPVILFFHGGGFTIGSIESHDKLCRHLAVKSQSQIISVEYSLAPEHPYPAALQDCISVQAWLRGTDSPIDLRNRPLILAGDSAGGALALCLAQENVRQAYRQVDGLLLAYPVGRHSSADYESYELFAEGYGLTAETMRWFWACYLGSESHGNCPSAEPLRMAFDNLPKSYVMTGEFDVLRDEGFEIVERLKAAGVPTVHRHYDCLNHSFLSQVGHLDIVTDALEDAAAWLRTIGSDTDRF